MKAVVALLLGLGVAPVFAHHSFEAEYDDKKPVVLTGTVTKVDWMNPHIWVRLDAKDDNGVQGQWACEGGNPNSLYRLGWKRDTLKPGQQIVINGFRAKDGTNTCNGRSITFPDGKKLFAGSSGDGGPQQ